MNKTHSHEILKSWGKGKETLPYNNSILRDEILSKVSFSAYPIQRPIPTPYPYLSMAFATLALIVFVGSSIDFKNDYQSSVPTMSFSSAPSDAKMAESTISSMYYPDNQGLSIKDTREFLKTSYSADIKTKNIEESATKVENTVRLLGGRIDNSHKGMEAGYISFALPEYRLALFRDELLEIAGKKLIIEQTNSENLLAQKQYIEQQKRATEGYSDYLNKEEQKLNENLRTVNGTISLQRVNLWEIGDIYTPGPLLAWLLVLVAVLAYLRYRRTMRAYY